MTFDLDKDAIAIHKHAHIPEIGIGILVLSIFLDAYLDYFFPRECWSGKVARNASQPGSFSSVATSKLCTVTLVIAGHHPSS